MWINNLPLLGCSGRRGVCPLWVGCGPTNLAAQPGLRSESNFRFRCYWTPGCWAWRYGGVPGGSAHLKRTSRSETVRSTLRGATVQPGRTQSAKQTPNSSEGDDRLHPPNARCLWLTSGPALGRIVIAFRLMFVKKQAEQVRDDIARMMADLLVKIQSTESCWKTID